MHSDCSEADFLNVSKKQKKETEIICISKGISIQHLSCDRGWENEAGQAVKN